MYTHTHACTHTSPKRWLLMKHGEPKDVGGGGRITCVCKLNISFPRLKAGPRQFNYNHSPIWRGRAAGLWGVKPLSHGHFVGKINTLPIFSLGSNSATSVTDGTRIRRQTATWSERRKQQGEGIKCLATSLKPHGCGRLLPAYLKGA